MTDRFKWVISPIMKPGPDKQFDPEVALAKAMDVFWHRGYEAASMAELTRVMGIGKKSLYDTFGNKRSLFIQTIRYYAQNNVVELRRELFAPGSHSVLENLRNVLQSWQKSHSKAGSKGCLLGTNIADFDTSDEEIAAALRQSLRHVEDAFTEALEQSQRNGEIQLVAPPREIARTLVCLSQGIALLGRVMDSGEVLESALQVASSQILEPT